VKLLIHIRKKELVLQRRKHLQGRPSPYSGLRDISWFHPEGRELSQDEWNNPSLQVTNK
jgi:isoamylase